MRVAAADVQVMMIGPAVGKPAYGRRPGYQTLDGGGTKGLPQLGGLIRA